MRACDYASHIDVRYNEIAKLMSGLNFFIFKIILIKNEVFIF